MRIRVEVLSAVIALLGIVIGHAPVAAHEGDWVDHPPAYAADEDHGGRGEFSLGLGYSRINFEGDVPLVDRRDCVHLEPVVSFAPFENLQQLRLGAAVGWSVAVDETRGSVISGDDGLIVATTSDVSFMMFEPELRLSWRQPLGRDGFYFIEPGIAAGAAVGWLDVSGAAADDPTLDADFTETDASFQWKVFLRAGLPFSTGLAGIEASYMSAGRLEFTDDVRGEPNEFYVGIFGALQF